MNYSDWLMKQIQEYGQVEKPVHYKLGEWKALNEFANYIYKANCLDVGCAAGTGMLAQYYLGAQSVVGIDINPEKIKVAKALGLRAYDCEATRWDAGAQYDFIWCSHTLEHVFNPDLFLDSLHDLLIPGGYLGIIVPYPDTGTPDAHVASRELGLYIEDEGKTFIEYLAQKFSVVTHKLDNFREPEIWVLLQKLEA